MGVKSMGCICSSNSSGEDFGNVSLSKSSLHWNEHDDQSAQKHNIENDFIDSYNNDHIGNEDYINSDTDRGHDSWGKNDASDRDEGWSKVGSCVINDWPATGGEAVNQFKAQIASM